MPASETLTATAEAYNYVNTRNLITSVGVAADRALTRTDVEHLLVYSGVLDDISKWVLADLLVWGEGEAERQVGERGTREFWDKRDQIWDEMLRYCKSDIKKTTAYNMAGCSRAWSWERRRQTTCVSFEHHRLLVGKSVEEQEYWLDVVEAGEWSVARLRQSLYSGQDPLADMRVMPPHEPLWTDERIKSRADELDAELYSIHGGNTRPWQHYMKVWKAISFEIRGEYEDELQRQRRARYYRPAAGG